MKNSETPRIEFQDNVFKVKPDEFIEILNESLKQSNLPEIKSKGEIEKYVSGDMGSEYECVKYTNEISSELSLELYSYPELGDGIAVIILQCKGKTGINKQLNEQADKYYKVICPNIEPRFDVKNFDTCSSYNTNYKLDDLVFYCIYSKVNEDGRQYICRSYGIHAVDLDPKYEEY